MDPGDWLGEQVFDVDGAKLRLSFAIVDGRPEVVGFELWRADPRTQPWRNYDDVRQMRFRDNCFDVKQERPIATSDLRAPLQRFVNDWLSDHKQTVEHILGSPVASAQWKRRVRKAQKKIDSLAAPRPGRKPVYDRDHFEKVAAVYRQALRERKPPTKAVADCPEWGPVDVSTAAKWVSRACHEFGFLPLTTQGKPAAVKPPRKNRRTPK